MGHWPDKYVIGLTGNLATGKSQVRKMLEHLGAYTIDAGGLAYQAMAPGAPAYKPVIQFFGFWLLDAEKRVDRARLDAVTFAHPEALRRRQALTQPLVSRALDTLISRARHRVVVVEAIDLLEGHLADKVDAIWVVDATPEHQLQRLEKNGLSEWEARKRIDQQNPQAEKIARAAVVIDNNDTPEATWKRVQEEWAKLVASLGHQEEPEAEAPRIAVAPGPEGGAQAIREVQIKRGKPGNAEELAALLSAMTGSTVSRMDVMMAFGQKSYLLADGDGRNVAVAGFQVENLITRVDEFFVKPEGLIPAVITGLIEAVEEASRELQSEVGFFFLPEDIPQPMLDIFLNMGYELRTLEQIKFPAWREAAREGQPEGTRIYAKQLRAERVLKPL
ncbi:MAG: dephospho-CoA kinase [Anaerolineae bacterium]|nr:dephospho-CoA kinase [Anaerolineae bacterium]